jgi:hypothetical protein
MTDPFIADKQRRINDALAAFETPQVHTPTPWKVFTTRNGYFIGIGEPTGEGITDRSFGVWRGSGAEALANATFIVRAVNVHDDLIEALKDAADELEHSGLAHDHPSIVKARAAIAKATTP